MYRLCANHRLRKGINQTYKCTYEIADLRLVNIEFKEADNISADILETHKQNLIVVTLIQFGY